MTTPPTGDTTRDEFVAHLKACVGFEFMHLCPSDAAGFLSMRDEHCGYAPAEDEVTPADIARLRDAGCLAFQARQHRFVASMARRRGSGGG